MFRTELVLTELLFLNDLVPTGIRYCTDGFYCTRPRSYCTAVSY
jgi:hypothetical protein